jgi:hypothetical protein
VKRILRAILIALAAGFAGYVAWDRVEAHRLSNDIAAIAARGEPTDLSSLDAAPETPQQQEAAQLYAEAAARAREISQQDSRVQRVDVDGVLGRLDVVELEGAYRKDAPPLQLLDRATPLPFTGFGDAAPGPDWVNTAGLQALNALSALRADLLAYRGDGDAAVHSLIAAIRIQRTLVDSFARSLLGARQLGSLRILLRHAAPSPASLEALQRAFAELPDEDGLDRELLLRRARLIEQLGDGGVPGEPPAPIGFLIHPFTMHRVRVQLEQFPEVIAAARQPWPDKLGSLAAIAERSPSNFRPGQSILRSLIALTPPNIAALSAGSARGGLNLATRRIGVTAMAIERYRRAHAGTPPPDLAALVPALLPAVPLDPFTGHPLVYKPGPDAYALYSTDVNRLDDGGMLYGIGSLNPMPLPRTRDFGIKVPLKPQPGTQ